MFHSERTVPAAQRCVVLISGGLDSAVAGAIAYKEGDEIWALTIDYGQRHSYELECARHVASSVCAVQHKQVRVDLRAIGGSALTSDTAPSKSKADWKGDGAIPNTYVPARNMIFLTLALAHAEVVGASRIVLGINAVDYSGYPDCRPEFLSAFAEAARLGTKVGIEGAAPRIDAPLLKMSKSQIIRKGMELGVDFGVTSSCYDPSPIGAPCRSCDSCRIRLEGFQHAGLVDPLLLKFG